MPVRWRCGAEDYFGPPLNRGSWWMAAGYGGQILLSGGGAAGPLGRAGGAAAQPGGAPVAGSRGAGAGLPAGGPARPPGRFPRLRLDAAASGPARQFGDVIRGYEVRERLCSRRVSVVYRAFQPTVGREVAVKVIRPELAYEPHFVRRFEPEALPGGPAGASPLVPLYDFCGTPMAPTLCCRCMAGGPPGRPVGPWPLDRVIRLPRRGRLCAGPRPPPGGHPPRCQAGQRPLRRRGNAYLADFGIVVPGGGGAGGVAVRFGGVPGPRGPGRGAVDERSDVYSLARVVAGLFTGPADGSDGGPPDLSGLDAPLRGLLEGALSEDPAQRPESVDSLVGRLNSLNGGRAAATPAGAGPQPLQGAASLRHRRRPRLRWP